MSGWVKALAGYVIMFVGIYSGNLTLAKIGFSLAGMGLLEEASKLFLPSAPKSKYAQDVEYSGTVTPRRILYGELRVGGLNTMRPTVADQQGQLLQQVLTIAGHACESVDTVYFNDYALRSSQLTAITGTDNDGKVTSGPFANLAWVRVYLGSDTQTVDYKLNASVPNLWTENHRGRGVTYAAITYKLDQAAYGNGKPTLNFVVKGKKCYDPRLDTAPGTNPTDTDYIAWTTNPALQLADYLMDANLGRGIPAAKIDWSLVVAAANICDEDVAIPGGTQARYTSSVMLEASGGRHEDNIKALASAMMGICYRQGGKYRMYAGAALTPSFALSEDDIVGETTVRMETPIGDAYNFVRGTFTDAARQYTEVEFEPRSNAAYEAADGLRITKTIPLQAVTNQYEAQRDAIAVLRRSRMKKTMTARFGLPAYRLRPWMVGTMTFAPLGWVNERVVCMSWKFDESGSIEVMLQEDSAAIWADPTEEQYDEPGEGGSVDQTSYVPDPPTDLTVNPGGDGVQFAWTLPTTLPGDVVELLEYTASTPSSSATVVWTGFSSQVMLPRNDPDTLYYWVRIKATNGNYSSTEPPTEGLEGTGIAAPDTLWIYPNTTAITKTDSTADITTGYVWVTAFGGTEPYTYLWTKLTGDTITVSDDTNTTVTFSATGLAVDEQRQAVFKCTVTDSASPVVEADCEVSVTITRANVVVTANPTSVSAETSYPSAKKVTTPTTTVTATGGNGYFTYNWTRVSGDTITPNSLHQPTTSFSGTVSPGQTLSAVYRCTATDTSGSSPAAAGTADVNVSVSNTYGT